MKIQETISVKEEIAFEVFIDPVIFRREFIRYKKRYLSLYDQNELVHAYIFLQIYLECFLHSNMRHIIELEFKPPRDAVANNWQKKEKDKLIKKLDTFNSCFKTTPKQVQDITNIIKLKFQAISNIRNMFAHGHKISMGMTSNGHGIISPAATKLALWELKKALTDANELGKAWNSLLSFIQPKLKALRRVRDFKFKPF